MASPAGSPRRPGGRAPTPRTISPRSTSGSAHIDAILARHQLTNGTGSVILYQIENELASTGTSQRNYMQHMYDKVRADGITVPIFSNDKGRNGIWVPSSSTVPGTVPGPVDLYAFDGYPGGTCHTDNSVGGPSTAPDWGIQGAGGAKGGSTASPEHPWIRRGVRRRLVRLLGQPRLVPVHGDPRRPRLRTGLLRDEHRQPADAAELLHDVRRDVVGLAARAGRLHLLRLRRGDRRGAPTAAEGDGNEARSGYLLQSVPDIAKVDKGSDVVPSASTIKVYHDVNPDTGTAFYIAMHNPSNATTNDAFTFPLQTADGSYQVPQQGTLRINGQDAKTLVADYDMDGQHLVYSTSEIMTHFAQGSRDVALLHGRDGEDGETVLRYGVAADRRRARRRRRLAVRRRHRRPAAELHPPGPGRGADQRRRAPSAAAPAGRRHDGRNVLAAGHVGRPGARTRPGTRAYRDDRTGRDARADRRHDHDHRPRSCGLPRAFITSPGTATPFR